MMTIKSQLSFKVQHHPGECFIDYALHKSLMRNGMRKTIFACIGIQTHYILTQVFLLHLPCNLKPLLACTVEPQLGASSVGNLTEPVISTVSVTSNQTHPEPVHSVE